MTAIDDSKTRELLERARTGSQSAVRELLSGHRDRLRRMVAVRLDPRIAARVDPSDVVQETLVDASRKLPEYLERTPIPFYPWLRRLAWDHLVHLQLHHVRAQRRTVLREEAMQLPDQSALALAQHFFTSGTSPTQKLVRKELRSRVRDTLDEMPPQDREVLVLRYLEQLSNAEVAAVLGISERTAQVRHREAVERIQTLLSDKLRGDQSC